MDKIRQLMIFLSFLALLSCFSTIICPPAIALLREHHESPGVLRYHAQSSLKDKQGYTWQIILFPEPQSSKMVNKYHLRLVGFPGIFEFRHPQPLEIITRKGQVLEAKDLLTVSSPAPNVGEFDLTDILPLLPEKGALKLSLILGDRKELALSLPESTIIEWQWLTK